MASEEKIFEYVFSNLAFRLPWQPIKFSGLAGLLKEHFCQNICNEIEIKHYFHFSHYKSTETIGYHSDESTRAMAIKNTTYVGANVMNKVSAPPSLMLLRRRFFNMFSQI